MENNLRRQLIMLSKRLVYAFLFQLFLCTVLLANTGNAQRKSFKEVKVSLNLTEQSLAHFFKQVESKTDFKFTYTDNLVDLKQPITVVEKNKSVYDVLMDVSIQTHLNFVQANENIHVKVQKGNLEDEAVKVILKADINVSGIVKDESGEPIPGVTVLVKGTTIGAVTELDGTYALTAPEGAILVFSFVGYVEQEINVGNQSKIDVTLKEDETSLDEIVIVGYGTVRKTDITGSLSSLSSEDFNPGMQASVDQMIQGRAAGVQITQASSEPGGGVSIRIRGSASLTAGNEPLYVIDGLPIDNSPAMPGYAVTGNQTPRNPLNSLNPGDIESIEILKDASSTAIYGSRGANGVILITTKKGKKGAISVDYSGYFGVQEVAKRLNVLKAPDYMSFLNDLRIAQGQPVEFSQQEINAIGLGTDWQSEIFRSAPVHNHQVSFSGGSDNTQYYASLNYFDQDGVVINSGAKRYTAKLNLNHSLNRFNFGLNLNSAFVEDTYVPHGTSINEGAGVINTALYQDPTLAIFDASGRYAESETVNLENPVGLARGVIDQGGNNRTFGNVFAEYAVLGNLKAKLNLGSDRQTSRRDTYVSRFTRIGAQTGGNAIVQTSENFNDLMEFTLNFEKQFNDNHRINAVGGYTYQVFTERGLTAGANNFINDALLTNNLAAGDRENYSIGSFRSKNQLQSYLGRVNYALFDKYLVTASFRVDGSSRFGENNKYGYFPSFALGWRMGEEDFIKNLNIFSDLKLRTSYGITGNQEIGNYRSLVLLGLAGQAVFNDALIVGIAPTQFANPNLKWETTSQFNIGLDFEILEGRISGSTDYFQKKTSDLLLNLPIPNTTGFGTSLQNVGSTSNSGFELMVNSENITGIFNWSTSFNISTIRNKVTDLGGLPFIIQGGAGFASGISILRVGDPINAYFGYVVDGVYQTPEEIVGSAQPSSKPGELKYKDTNQDNQITPEDRVILGSPYPDYSFGLNNSFRYKGFDLSIFFQGVYGSEMFNFNTVEAENPISFRRNRLESMLNRWTPENPTNDHPSYIPPAVTYGNAVNSRAVEDASYLRFKNIRLGYSFPKLKSKYLNTLSVYFTGQNLLTITNYTGYDPEVSAFGTSNIRADYNAYPLSKTYTMGINLGLK